MFDLLKDYPAHGVSWHVWETPPSIQEFLTKTENKCIVGGLQRFNITDDLRDKLDEDISRTLSITGGKRLILAPGCNIRSPFKSETLDFIRQRISKIG
jgi:uroporphyrinogen decarboxylase